MCRTKRKSLLFAGLFILSLVTSCAPRWELGLVVDGAVRAPITGQQWSTALESFASECIDESVPLERLLAMAGVPAVESISVDGQSWPWSDIYKQSWLGKDGTLMIGDEQFTVEELGVTLPEAESRVAVQLIDIAPTVAGALGVRSPEETQGRAVAAYDADHVVYIFIDGLGYETYEALVGSRTMSFLDSLVEPRLARSVYPSITKASTAAMITGAPPQVNGVASRDVRDTESETIFEVLTAEGRSSVAVEGSALAFNMDSTQLILSGDRDGDGYSDDNTYQNTLEVMEAGLPDFMWVHFHGVDDAGHSYGPRADETLAIMTRVDTYVADIIQRLPENTLVIISADHGMHDVQEDDRFGNHGSLMSEDMYIPFWAVQL